MCTINPTTLTDFTNFNSAKYNTLPEVVVSSKILQQRNDFPEFMEKIFSLAKAHSIELGVRLIHRHMQVDEGKVMIEKFQLHQNAPAFITSADFPTDKVYPVSWLLEDDNKLTVFEYSTDILVEHTLKKLIKDTDVFRKLCDLIREYYFENLLASCITARDSLKQFDKENGFMEITNFESKASIVKNKKDQAVSEDSDDVVTLWAYPVNNNCLSSSYRKNDDFGCDHTCHHKPK
ncbi:hypothetical protein C1645_816713 [Glomus cerebriforme]|uniref:Uncharacterized protein n=1 Tax=Glomus cerebriforme TaxID=658196 RepID=A0A397TB27_9GLOM|nr:hypothetical protein C1645_816713 [Glomus cerebriforme]